VVYIKPFDIRNDANYVIKTVNKT